MHKIAVKPVRSNTKTTWLHQHITVISSALLLAQHVVQVQHDSMSLHRQCTAAAFKHMVLPHSLLLACQRSCSLQHIRRRVHAQLNIPADCNLLEEECNT